MRLRMPTAALVTTTIPSKSQSRQGEPRDSIVLEMTKRVYGCQVQAPGSSLKEGSIDCREMVLLGPILRCRRLNGPGNPRIVQSPTASVRTRSSFAPPRQESASSPLPPCRVQPHVPSLVVGIQILVEASQQ